MREAVGHEPKLAEAGVSVGVDAAQRINVAFHQNQVPTIGAIELSNGTSQDLSDIAIEITSTPPFLAPKRLTLDRVAAGGLQVISPVAIGLDPKVLLSLKERVRGEIGVRVLSGDTCLAHYVHGCDLLAPDEWTGVASAPELIASFVRPNDPAIDYVLRRAVQKLEAAKRSPTLDGYTNGKKARVWEMAEAIWVALCEEAIAYALPPASFERDGQKVRSPSAILERKLATCLDLTLMLCAAFEQAGLNPLVLFTKGHAFVGLWLTEHEFAQVVIDEPQVIRKRRDLDDLVLIETTLLCQRSRFANAIEQGRRQVEEDAERPFELAVDIKRARLRRITPLGFGEDGATSTTLKLDVGAPIDMRLSAPPAFMEDIGVVELEPANLTRLEKWKRKLLDLSLRNRLLNFKTGKGSIRLVCPDPSALEDKLAQGTALRLLPKAGVMEGGDIRSADLQIQTKGEDAAKAYARDALVKGDVHTDLTAEELEDRLTDLYRTARSTLEEGGVNSLHLSLGFVRWSPADRKGGEYSAPLLLLPVSLERRSLRSGFKLNRHDDDTRINPTLLQMLRQDFGLVIPEFDQAELPMDASGLDVARIWSIARKYLVDAKGFEVTEEVVLSTFSFAKYLMWKDLVDRTETLKENRVVKHLIDTPTATFGHGGGLPNERELDRTVAAKDLFLPLPADSSQIAAVVAASRAKDFVLFGPPGTGKSQTIANMITHLLGEGKTVLFVSQKTTALEVVRQRLDRIGLGRFCLEVHSAKAQKNVVLAQLQQSWEYANPQPAREWGEKAADLDDLRGRLNAVVAALHQTRRNGMTAYAAMGRVVAFRDRWPGLRLAFSHVDQHDEAGMRRLRELCGEVRVALRAVGDPATHPLRAIRQTQWSPAWRNDLTAAVEGFGQAALGYLRAFKPVQQFLNVAPPEDPRDAVAIVRLGVLALKPWAADAADLIARDTTGLRPMLSAWLAEQDTAAKATERLSRRYSDGVYDLNFPALLEEWRAAQAAGFITRPARKRKVWAALDPFTSDDQPPDLGAEIATLSEVASARARLAKRGDAMDAFGALWGGPQTDGLKLAAALDWVDEVREAARACAGVASPQSLLHAFERMVRDHRHELGVQGQVRHAFEGFVAAYKAFADQRQQVARLATDGNEMLGAEPSPAWLKTAVTTTRAWLEVLDRANAWSNWQRAARTAEAEGLGPLMSALKAGELQPDELPLAFEVAYARWWIDEVVTLEPALRDFLAEVHEDTIGRFARLDAELADLSRHVVAARLSHGVPSRTAFGTDPEWGTLSRELAKKSRHMPLRQLFSQMPKALSKLAPCMMMSPLSIAQFLPPGATVFDVVIFDEASQMPVWDAVGAIARGRQVVVVGDPKQLPPTTFFDRAAGETLDPSEIEDLDSILDECLAASIPHKRLNWHYRSRHESLIAFSNERYYESQLVTFPSPVTDDRAVRYVHVADGAYERGGGRVNKGEARAVVADVVARLKDPRFAAQNGSIGIVTFNAEQQRLIENLLEAERRAHPQIERFFSREWHEPVFVKNLESVQGDERDVILFSIGYGPDANGHLTQNFGPLNLDGGARRLNVAITRARHELVVFAKLRPEQIDLSRAKGEGVRDFKHFLEFAERGPRALAEAAAPTGREADSDFERAVRARLEARGWVVHPQVGVSGFRIDLGIVHPDAPGRYLAAVECDGATYHRSATARDRDRLREAVLRGLGWRVRRVWSTDWWTNADMAMDRLHAQLQADLNEQRAKDAEQAALAATAGSAVAADGPHPVDAAIADEGLPPSAQRDVGPTGAEGVIAADAVEPPRRLYADGPTGVATASRAAGPPTAAIARYQVADLAAEGFTPEPDRFHETSYRPILRRMAAHVIMTEGPVFDDVVVRRLARFHDFKKAGSQIRATVLDVIERRFPKSKEGERTLYWPEGSDRTISVCRLSGTEARDHSDIPEIELTALARSHLMAGATPAEAAVLMARDLGLGQLRSATRERFEVIAQACGSAIAL